MHYQSTRGSSGRLSAAEAIIMGLCGDGGLCVPESFPQLTPEIIENLASKPYSDRAASVLGMFLDDFSAEELSLYARQAYKQPNFDHPSIAPLLKLDDYTFFLELWHGPTCAFKDMALQILPQLLSASLGKTNEKREVCILVATSGDTGKAALEGFCDVPGTKIMVFYPRDGVSDVQKLQMVSQSGENVNVVAVEGNFDNAQNGVKAIFSDEHFRKELNERGYFLSSANSINWGRLVPQIAYYISAYCDLLNEGDIQPRSAVNYCVPTGNFGNILAGYYAGKMGLPINKLICASNRNDVLTEFIRSGVYSLDRPFYTTLSPSMDILVSSNLERLLFDLFGRDGSMVSGYMSDLSKDGRYEVPASVGDALRRLFAGGRCSEEETQKTIARMFFDHNYLIDTHTAVACKVLDDYRADSLDETPAIVVSTASPYKFCDGVLNALGRKSAGDDVALISELEKFSGCAVPRPIASLSGKTRRFLKSVPIGEMKAAVRDFLE